MLHKKLKTSFIRLAATAVAFTLIFSATVYAQGSEPTSAKEFFRSIKGEWIGTCEQSTDGEQAENKYFYAKIKQIDDHTFDGQFEYYRLDKDTGNPVKAGTTSISIDIGPDGTAKSKMSGQGMMFVNKQLKQQKHELAEVFIAADGKLHGQGSGTISVANMPLGLGKNGKIKNCSSDWSLKNDTLIINQTVKAGFKAFVFSKSFDVAAKYTATRGSDVVSLMTGKLRIARRA